MYKRLVLPLLLILILTPLADCGNASVVNNLQAVVSGARDVVAALAANDPNLAGAQKFVTDAQALLDAYKAAVAADPNACVDVASLAANLVSAFQSAILPLLHVSPIVAAAIAGIDVALRLVVANLHTCITKMGSKASRVLTSAAMSKTMDADKVFKEYLASPKVKK